MYHLFTGKLPSGRYPDPSELNPDLSEELNQLILQYLQEDPNHRPDSAEELKIRLLALPRAPISMRSRSYGQSKASRVLNPSSCCSMY
jgi:serine/threonine protein kinase